MGKGQALEVAVNKRDELVERLKAWALENHVGPPLGMEWDAYKLRANYLAFVESEIARAWETQDVGGRPRG